MNRLTLPLALLLGCGLTDDLPPAVELPVRLNEIMANSETEPDWVEIYNLSDAPVLLEGWRLSDDSAEWRLPASAALAPRGFLVLLCDGEGDGSAPFKLSSGGERLSLSDPQGRLVDALEFGPQDSARSLARLTDGVGEWGVGVPTPGASNAGGEAADGGQDAPPPVVMINEVMVDAGDGAGWVELYHPEAPPPFAGWRLSARGGDVALPASPLPSAGLTLLTLNPSGGADLALSLSAAGDTLSLLDAVGAEVDRITLPALAPGQSYGRTPDGGAGLGVLPRPSPGQPNL
ncbi:lamin tail domain-containing protein [Myxococcota bacterium]|nr:lamin tail domain-containing protein [Myxococcota bacterium]